MNNVIEFSSPFFPYCTLNSYRKFHENEKHIMRISNENVMIFMIENTLYFNEDGKDIELGSGQFYIQKAKLKQEGLYPCPSPKYYYIHFKVLNNETTYNNMLSGNGKNITLPVTGHYTPSILIPLFDKMDALTSLLPFDYFKKQIVFQTIIKHLINASSTTKNPTALLADQIIDYINENYSQIRTCMEIKNIFHYSEDHISNTVKKYYGITPWQYIVKLRIENAMEQLTNTNHNIEYIANNTGYNDITVFYKAFKAHTLCSPQQWRQKSRQL